MSTIRITANTTAQTAATVAKHKKIQLGALNIDNQHTAETTIYVLDSFTPDASNGVAAPVATVLTRLQVTVPAGLSLSYQKDALEDALFLGTVQIQASTVSTSCVIIPAYKGV